MEKKDVITKKPIIIKVNNEKVFKANIHVEKVNDKKFESIFLLVIAKNFNGAIKSITDTFGSDVNISSVYNDGNEITEILIEGGRDENTSVKK